MTLWHPGLQRHKKKTSYSKGDALEGLPAVPDHHMSICNVQTFQELLCVLSSIFCMYIFSPNLLRQALFQKVTSAIFLCHVAALHPGIFSATVGVDISISPSFTVLWISHFMTGGC